MADLSQINLPPAQPVQGPPQIAQGTTSHSNATVATLPAGTVLQGFIINRDASGNPIVRTDKGDIPFATNFFLKIGSEVVVRITGPVGNTVANLLSVDGQPPEIAQNISAFAQEPEVILSPNLTQAAPAAATVPGTPASPPATVTISGTVVSQPPATTTPTATPAPPLSNGTQLILKIVSLTPPAAPVPTAAPATPPTQPELQTTAAQTSSAFYATYARAAATTPTAIPTAVPTATISAATPTAPTPQTPVTTTVLQPSVPQATPLPTTAPTPQTTTVIAPPAATAEPAAPALPQQAAATPEQSPTIPTPPTPQTATAAPASPPAAPTTITAAPIPVTTTATPPPAQTIQPGNTITATVISSEPSGELLVQSPAGVVRLQAGTPIPVGSRIALEIVQATPPSPQTVASTSFTNTQPAPLTELAQQWSSIQQIFTLLAGRPTATGLDSPAPFNDTPSTYTATAHATPANTPAPSISTALLTFLSALRKNDFDNWLGADNIRLLQSQGHDDLLKKAQAEFSQLGRQLTQSQPGHWQPLFFPVAVDGNIQQLRLFIKRDRKQSNTQDTKKQEDTRFVIEVDLTQLGELQMDGFVRTQDKELQFDMVIRSLSGLPRDVQEDIAQIYNNMGAITGYKGSLTFQNVKEFPVNPMQDIGNSHDTVIA